MKKYSGVWLIKWFFTALVTYLYFDTAYRQFGDLRMWPLGLLTSVAVFYLIKNMGPRK